MSITNQDKPLANIKQVIVINNSSVTVRNEVNGDIQNIASGSSYTWTYTTSSFTYAYDTQLGFDITTTKTDGLTWTWTLSDSISLPGLVQASGTGSINGSLSNASQPYKGVVWDTWTVAWEDETRTWDELAEIMQNSTVGLSELFFSHRRFPFTETAPFLTGSGITNTNRPS